MHRIWTRIVTASALLAAASAFAQPAKPGDGTISKQEATKTALEAVPGGRIKSVELEHEGGKHVWSFDITRPGTPGATEIQVDAKSGRIVSRKEESPAEEAKEAQADKVEKSRARR
jgi:uncharacterized membrane protein YkoI